MNLNVFTLLFLIMFVLKVLGYLKVSWWIVWSPIWVAVPIALILLIIGVVAKVLAD